MFQLKNFTPHKTLRFEHEDEIVELPCKGVARCKENYRQLGYWDDQEQFPKFEMTYGEVEGLPDPEPGTVFIVSQLVTKALPAREDLAYPSDFTRIDGEIYSFKKLVRPGKSNE